MCVCVWILEHVVARAMVTFRFGFICAHMCARIRNRYLIPMKVKNISVRLRTHTHPFMYTVSVWQRRSLSDTLLCTLYVSINSHIRNEANIIRSLEKSSNNNNRKSENHALTFSLVRCDFFLFGVVHSDNKQQSSMKLNSYTIVFIHDRKTKVKREDRK